MDKWTSICYGLLAVEIAKWTSICYGFVGVDMDKWTSICYGLVGVEMAKWNSICYGNPNHNFDFALSPNEIHYGTVKHNTIQ